MSDSELYVIELGEPIGPLVPMERLTSCKDCAYHDERGYMPGRVTCRMHSGIWDKDDFCSKAKKREGER